MGVWFRLLKFHRKCAKKKNIEYSKMKEKIKKNKN